MKTIQIILSAIIVAVIVSSCEKDVVLDIAPGDIDPVIDGWIYNNSGPILVLSKQFSGYGSFNQATLSEELGITQAEVKVSENNGPKINLYEQSIFDLPSDLLDQILDVNEISREFSSAIASLSGFTLEQQLSFVQTANDSSLVTLINNFNFYIDTTNTIVGTEGSSYQLEIIAENRTLFSETTLPLSIPINYLTYSLYEDDPNLVSVKMNLTVPNNYDSFVKLANSRNGNAFISPDYFGANLSDNGIYAGSGTIELPLFRGYLNNDEEPDDLGEMGLFELGDTVVLKWQNIDEATYNFWYSVYNGGGDSPFSSVTPIKSNIVNGVGLWAGYTTTYETIILD